ncbi:hypothetical protein [Stenotrophomonas maltophilia]|uniref:hypothetical protein n=1 Tax=Stenotrophomonas maltophilia TaxID=40324 RepID=UPI0039F6A3C2
MLRLNQGAGTMKGISWMVAAVLATVLGGCTTLKGAGETTYIGKVVVSGLFDRQHSRPTWISVRDREAESLRLQQQTQPWLLERHPFHTRLATPAPGAPSADALAEQFRSCTPACDSILALPLFIR